MAGACQGGCDSTTTVRRRRIPRPGILRYNRLMATFDIINPATSAVLDRAPDATADDAKQAIEKSVAAFVSWKAKTAFERSAILRKWYELILGDEAALARLMTQEMGKPISESRGEVKYAAAFVEWYAEEAKRAYGEIVPTHAGNKRLLATRQPVGPVFAVTPWNFPAAMVTRKVAPALAAGCSVVLKPAEQSPLTAIRLEELWVKAGGPPDVFQVMTTSNPSAFSDVFFEDARVRKLTFTGSTEIGIKLYKRRRARSSAYRSNLVVTRRSSFATTPTSRRRCSRSWHRSFATPARPVSARTASTCMTGFKRRLPSRWPTACANSASAIR